MCAFYFYKLIGKLFASFQLQEFSRLRNLPVDSSTSAARRKSSQLRAKVDSTLTKAAALRVNLNLDGAPIVSRTHTHPSHSQTSRLLTSSLSLGVEVRNPVYVRCANPLPLDFSLSSHRPSYISLLYSSHSIHLY
jgi:hypothetical protein